MLTYIYFEIKVSVTVSLSENMTLMHQIVLGDIRQNHWTMKYRSHRPTFIFMSNVGSYRPIIPKYDVHTSRCYAKSQDHEIQVTVTYIYFEVKCVILTHYPKL